MYGLSELDHRGGKPLQNKNTQVQPAEDERVKDELRERLAALCHEQWSGWMRYFFEQCQYKGHVHPGGYVLILSTEYANRWLRQMNTPYAELSEEEKKSDRKEASRFLSLLPVQPAQPDEIREALEGMVAAFDTYYPDESIARVTRECAMNGAKRVLGWDKLIRPVQPAASTPTDNEIDKVQHRAGEVVNAAIEWHQSGREGDNTWFDKAEALGVAIDRLLELRPPPQGKAIGTFKPAPSFQPPETCPECKDSVPFDEHGKHSTATSLLRDPARIDVTELSKACQTCGGPFGACDCLPPLVVTRNGVPCTDQKAALEEFKQAAAANTEAQDERKHNE